MKRQYIICVRSELKFDLIKLNEMLKSFDKDFELVGIEERRPLRFPKR